MCRRGVGRGVCWRDTPWPAVDAAQHAAPRRPPTNPLLTLATHPRTHPPTRAPTDLQGHRRPGALRKPGAAVLPRLLGSCSRFRPEQAGPRRSVRGQAGAGLACGAPMPSLHSRGRLHPAPSSPASVQVVHQQPNCHRCSPVRTGPCRSERSFRRAQHWVAELRRNAGSAAVPVLVLVCAEAARAACSLGACVP